MFCNYNYDCICIFWCFYHTQAQSVPDRYYLSCAETCFMWLWSLKRPTWFASPARFAERCSRALLLLSGGGELQVQVRWRPGRQQATSHLPPLPGFHPADPISSHSHSLLLHPASLYFFFSLWAHRMWWEWLLCKIGNFLYGCQSNFSTSIKYIDYMDIL